MIEHYSTSITKVCLDDETKQAVSPAAKRMTTPVSVVIVSYNSRELLEACLASIEPEQYDRVIVIDNASTDGSAQLIRENFPWVTLIASDKNHGYGGAANLAVASCSSKYVLLLNCDTLLQPGSLQALSEYLDLHPQAAIVGPALVGPDGTRQASCYSFPTPLQVLLRETSLSKAWPYAQSNDPPRFARAVPWVLGAALTIRKQAFESVGGFDRSFFMYYEEVDLCYRLKRSGWQTHFLPSATVTHIGGASTKQQRTAMTMQLYKSLCLFYRQHYSRMQSIQLKFVLTYLMLRNILKEALKISQKTNSYDARHPVDDLQVWRLILSNVWSKKGWLRF